MRFRAILIVGHTPTGNRVHAERTDAAYHRLVDPLRLIRKWIGLRTVTATDWGEGVECERPQLAEHSASLLAVVGHPMASFAPGFKSVNPLGNLNGAATRAVIDATHDHLCHDATMMHRRSATGMPGHDSSRCPAVRTTTCRPLSRQPFRPPGRSDH